MRQELNRSYKEICIPVLERCRFLLYEIKPAISIEMEAYKKVNILYKEPRVKTLVKKVIKDLKCGRHTSDIQKPEDIVNATIQSQSIDKHKSVEDLAKYSGKKNSSECCMTESKTDTDGLNNEIKNGADKTTAERAMTDSYNSNTSKHCSDQRSQKNCTDLKTELEEKWNVEKSENESRIIVSEEEKEKKIESNIVLGNLLNKLTEKQMKKVTSEKQYLMVEILDFVTNNSTCDIEILRRAMYCQVTY